MGAMKTLYTTNLNGLPKDILALFHPDPPLFFFQERRKTHPSPPKPDPVIFAIIKFNWDDIHPEKILYQNYLSLSPIQYERKPIFLSNPLIKNIYNDLNIYGDPFKTLYLSRLPTDISYLKLRKEFEDYGPISNLRIIHDKLGGKIKKYAFIEYERTSDMKRTIRMCNKKFISGKQVFVDVERGRVDLEWSFS